MFNIVEVERISHIIIDALRKAFKVHESLGVSGEEIVCENQFGEATLKIDIEVEKSILSFLKEEGLSIKIISEESGIVNSGENPYYLGILDSLDGSRVYKKDRGRGRYGTMFAIFDNTNPSYKDYIACGIMEHSTSMLFIASRGNGAFMFCGDAVMPIESSRRTILDQRTRIYIDECFEINKEVFSKKLIGFQTNCILPSSVYYVDVASGKADIALECTRKRNLEIAVAYGLEIEAGAVMVDIKGDNIGNKKYLKFGQEEQLSIITAASRELALELIDHIKD